MSNYAIKSDLKSKTGVDISEFAKNSDLGCIKADIDKLSIGKLEATLADLSKLSNVVKNKLFKRLYLMNWLTKLMLFGSTDSIDFVRKAPKLIIWKKT